MGKNEAETTALTTEQKLYQERLNRVETAIHLGTPDKVPVFAFFSSYMQRAYGSSYADIYYDFEPIIIKIIPNVIHTIILISNSIPAP